MPRFRFRLQRILRLKEQKEQAIKEELALLRRREWERERELERLRTELLQCQHTLSEKEQHPFYIFHILSYIHYIDKICADIKREEEELERLRTQIEEVKERLVAASKERRVLQRLRERRWEQYIKECEAEQQHFLDEIGVSMHHRGANRLSYKGD